MKILLDTNVIIDFLIDTGENALYASEVLSYAETGDEDEYVSTSAVTDIAYIINRATTKGNAQLAEDHRKTIREISYETQDKIRMLYNVIHFLPVTDSDIDDALNLRWIDFEDAVQYSVAKNNDIDMIITRNVKDYQRSEIPIYTPSDFVSIKKQK